ncbi:MAG: DUF2891 domain-containing protein [Candidatus Eiseniibacteriota bacterium]
MSLPAAMPLLDPSRASAIAAMVLACIHREFPVHMVHLVRGPSDLRPPRELNPAFFGSFDWHSAVHGHWTLARLARLAPDASWRPAALAALGGSLTAERLAGELAYLSGEGRQGFERPYGLAWLLQLAAELREWAAAGDTGADAARAWLAALEPLESLAADRILALLERLLWPVRGGEHAQTAFALGLTLDWARRADRDDVTRVVRARALQYYGDDRDAPVAYEPSGHDFLSPALGEADLMRRVYDGASYATWVERFLPDPGGAAAHRWLAPVVSPDRADGKLSHLDGLNLSRAWMLEGIAGALAEPHPWRAPLVDAARRHADAGLASVPAEHYAGAHWLGSFAVYLLTRRGRT